MNKKVDEEFKGIKDVYVLQCICTELNEARKRAIKYINCNKQKTICAYGDNEDDDFEICLWEEDIDNLLNILEENYEYNK